MAGIRVKLSSSGMDALLKSDEVRSELTERAQRVLAAAQADASNYRVTGDYYNGLTIRQDTTDRAAVRVVGTAPHSHLVEANRGTLARALDSAGGA